LCEVFTDKLVAKIPSTASGKVTEINFANDDIAPVGHILLKIETGADVEVAAARGSHQEPAKAAPKEQANSIDKIGTAPPGNSDSSTQSKALSTPAVRHLAKKENIDINKVPSTGKGGRVTKEDVLNFIKHGGAAAQ